MKILLAEDDDINRQLMYEILSCEGYEVIAVCDGQEMISKALESKPDLIITDIQMPNISGDTTIAMISEYESLADIPVIVVTGLSRIEFERLGLARDIDVIFKPVNSVELIEIVRKYTK
ncbi:MAG: response regulator [Elusimicrobiales bacterium]